jgi:hypothetical protein
MTRDVHSLIGPMSEGLDLGLGFLGGSWRKGNCGALGWKGCSSLGEQGFDILGFPIVGPWDDTLSMNMSGEQGESDPISVISVIKID